MVEKRLAQYYDRIIEKIPELQIVEKKIAYRIIEKCVKKYFSVMRGKLKQNPYCRLITRTNMIEFYISNKDAYKIKKANFRYSNLKAYYELIDVDETRLPSIECTEFKEWETNW